MISSLTIPKRLAFALAGLFSLVAGTLLVSGAIPAFRSSGAPFAEFEERRERLEAGLATLSGLRPPPRAVQGIVVEARLLAAKLEAMAYPEAQTAATRAKLIARLGNQLILAEIDAGDPRLTTQEAQARMREAHGGLETALTSLKRDVRQARQRTYTSIGSGVLALGALLILIPLGVGALRHHLVRPAERLAEALGRERGDAMLQGGFGEAAGGRFWLFGGWRRYSRALHAAVGTVLQPLEIRHRVLDSLPANVALLDHNGRIVHVNAAWTRFAEANGSPDPFGHRGEDYLAVCEATDVPEVHRLAVELREILAGERTVSEFEYDCSTPEQERWFRVMASRVDAGDPGAAAAAVVLHVDITDRKQAEQALERLAYVDRLTGLPSRVGLVRDLEPVLPSLHPACPHYLVVIDVQELHAVNQTYGYEAGDQLLVAVGQHLSAALNEGELLARIGGDQFALLIDPKGHDLTHRGVEEGFAGWIDEVLEAPFRATGYHVGTGVWIGVARANHDDTPADLLRRAALATHMARSRRGGHCLAYDEQIDERVQRQIGITRDLHRALREDQFVLQYQPAVSLSDGRILTAEALVRWQHPTKGMQPPDTFIPVAETSRLIVPIGEWSIRAACRQLAAWRAQGLMTGMAVNVSRTHFAHGDVAEFVHSAVAEAGIPAHALTLEITESVFEQQTDRLLEQLDRLHSIGVRLALDDFGTGYSSLSYLQQCAFDIIKLDLRFTRYLVTDTYSQEVVRMIRVLADALDASVIAEGVETAGQRDCLLELGCTQGQGYYYGRAMAAETLTRVLTSSARLPTVVIEDHDAPW